MVVTYSIWVIVTPNWSFTITADKSAYKLGEKVHISVSLKNIGFILHSFMSSISDIIVIRIGYVRKYSWVPFQVWYSQYQLIIRHFIWNQTNIDFPEEGIEPGLYAIEAAILQVDSKASLEEALFYAKIYINITST